MKQLTLAVLAIACLISCQAQSTETHDDRVVLVNHLDSLLNIKSYFKARSFYKAKEKQLDEQNRLRIGGTINNLFNKLDESKAQVNKLLNDYTNTLSRENLKDVLNVQLSNGVKTFDYALAYKVSMQLVSDFKDIVGDQELWSIKNNNIIWKALSDYPKQEVLFEGDSEIQLQRDVVGLKNLNVTESGKDYPFIFDTGANLSVVIESQAKEMNIEVIDVRVSVGTVTGELMEAKVGISSAITIGKMHFKNIVFLVFPDEALFISHLNYQIKGILGFPVIEAMNEIHFLQEGQVFVPKKSLMSHESNLAIEFLTPIINLETAKGEMHFTFDSGATRTALYRQYFETHKADVLAKYEETNVRFAGGAGDTTVLGYYVEFQPRINDSLVSIKPVALFQENLNTSDLYSYGNIGQDLISKFNKMIMNFEAMFIRFE